MPKCDICGKKVKKKELRKLSTDEVILAPYRNRPIVTLKVCEKCYEPPELNEVDTKTLFASGRRIGKTILTAMNVVEERKTN